MSDYTVENWEYENDRLESTSLFFILSVLALSLAGFVTLITGVVLYLLDIHEGSYWSFGLVMLFLSMSLWAKSKYNKTEVKIENHLKLKP